MWIHVMLNLLFVFYSYKCVFFLCFCFYWCHFILKINFRLVVYLNEYNVCIKFYLDVTTVKAESQFVLSPLRTSPVAGVGLSCDLVWKTLVWSSRLGFSYVKCKNIHLFICLFLHFYIIVPIHILSILFCWYCMYSIYWLIWSICLSVLHFAWLLF